MKKDEHSETTQGLHGECKLLVSILQYVLNCSCHMDYNTNVLIFGVQPRGTLVLVKQTKQNKKHE